MIWIPSYKLTNPNPPPSKMIAWLFDFKLFAPLDADYSYKDYSDDRARIYVWFFIILIIIIGIQMFFPEIFL
jgi:hypothetical protein